MKEGNKIRFSWKDKEFSGLLVQIKDSDLVIKLDTGYNMVVPKTDIKITEETENIIKTTSHNIKQDASLPKITILHTGGTIASKVDYSTGAVVAQFDPVELVAMFPEITTVARVESKLIRNMQSDDMRFSHYNMMAQAVIDEISKSDAPIGIIITHGTDTLHYSAAALSFALEGINVPVVLVGSQRSSDRGSSDASSNLMGATRFITTRAPGVFIAMHEGSDDNSIAIISGLHGRKNHSSRRDAFISVNASLVARVEDDRVHVLDQARLDNLKSAAHDKPRVMPFKENLKVGLWKVHTNAYADELIIYDHYDGLVIEGTGLGHAPINEIDEFTAEHRRISERIKQLAKKIPVAMTTQTISGRVNMNVYTPGRVLQEYGVLGQGCDMAPEVAFIKLAWLLSNYSATEARSLYAKDLRGEISVRSTLDDMHKE